jgi:hypothetical protein
VRLSPLGTAATTGPIVPDPDDDGDCGAISGMKVGRGNRSTLRKPASMPLCPPHIPHDLNFARTRGRRDVKPVTIRLSYGTTKDILALPAE